MNDDLNNAAGHTDNLDGASVAPNALNKRPRKTRSDAGKKRVRKAITARRANREGKRKSSANRANTPKRTDKTRSAGHTPWNRGKKTGIKPWNAGKKLPYKVWNAGKKTGIAPHNKGKKLNKKTGKFTKNGK